MMSDLEKIRRYIFKVVNEKDDNIVIDDSTSLVLSGILDSVDVVRLIIFIQNDLAVKVDLSTFSRGQLDSINEIGNFVSRHRHL